MDTRNTNEPPDDERLGLPRGRTGQQFDLIGGSGSRPHAVSLNERRHPSVAALTDGVTSDLDAHAWLACKSTGRSVLLNRDAGPAVPSTRHHDRRSTGRGDIDCPGIAGRPRWVGTGRDEEKPTGLAAELTVLRAPQPN